MASDPRPLNGSSNNASNGHSSDAKTQRHIHRNWWIAAICLLVAVEFGLLATGCWLLAIYCLPLAAVGGMFMYWRSQPRTKCNSRGEYTLPLGPKSTMLLVAIQCGMQPYIYRECTKGATLLKSEFVCAYNLIKMCMTIGLLVASGSFTESLKSAAKDSTRVAGLPAGVYAVQNLLTAVAFASISGLSYNLLNQTKIVWTALCVWLLMGRRIRAVQWVAIVCLCISGALIVLDEASAKESSSKLGDMMTHARLLGSFAALASAFCSGLTSALSERALHLHARPSLVFSTELATFEMITLALILVVEVISGWEITGDISVISEHGIFGQATALSLVPAGSQACGGILVGHLTKVTDGVSKCYVLIVAVMLSAVARVVIDKAPLTNHLMMALPLGLLSIWLNFGLKPKRKTA
eukprot:gnl/MRDRNA2_/MRDRNA2_79409_c0_seq2.p1 gnl/MRDRNA2_/MRDRNA2_79409_c0~~gnl/MRDRNA2_/MRDRNA2_79409_c0_seq2.p1  ORF type:complete len:410 (-),score=46.44 gnl/MRDRNA2_/MRDRNA2_79409_c0_seq2:181-1410(-)